MRMRGLLRTYAPAVLFATLGTVACGGPFTAGGGDGGNARSSEVHRASVAAQPADPAPAAFNERETRGPAGWSSGKSQLHQLVRELPDPIPAIVAEPGVRVAGDGRTDDTCRYQRLHQAEMRTLSWLSPFRRDEQLRAREPRLRVPSAGVVAGPVFLDEAARREGHRSGDRTHRSYSAGR